MPARPPLLRPLSALVAASLLLAGCGALPLASRGRLPVVASAQTRQAASDPTRVVVGLKAASRGHGASLAARYGMATAQSLPALNAAVLTVPAGKTAASLMGTLRADADVAYAEPDYLVHLNDPAPKPVKTRAWRALEALADPQMADQWGLAHVHAPQAWAITPGSPNVVIAVLDTGADLDHPDLRGNLVPGMTCFPSQGGPIDFEGHGSHVSGIIAGQLGNGVGIAGVAPGCKIMPVKVMGPTGPDGKVENVAAGLVWAVDHGASIINMSLGDVGTSTLLRDAVAYARSKDVVLVAASGNTDDHITDPHTMDYPAGYQGVMAVGAIDDEDHLADFSFWGSWLSVVAPGVNILSTVPGDEGMDAGEGNYQVEDGTSMASPCVAGVAALVRSRFPGLSADQVRARIERTAVDLGDPGYDDHFGHGRVDALAAISGN